MMYDFRAPLKFLIFDRTIFQCLKSIHSFSGPHSPAFELSTVIYTVNLRTQSKCGKIWTRKTLNTDTFHAFQLSCLTVLYSRISKFSHALPTKSSGKFNEFLLCQILLIFYIDKSHYVKGVQSGSFF